MLISSENQCLLTLSLSCSRIQAFVSEPGEVVSQKKNPSLVVWSWNVCFREYFLKLHLAFINCKCEDDPFFQVLLWVHVERVYQEIWRRSLSVFLEIDREDPEQKLTVSRISWCEFSQMEMCGWTVLSFSALCDVNQFVRYVGLDLLRQQKKLY